MKLIVDFSFLVIIVISLTDINDHLVHGKLLRGRQSRPVHIIESKKVSRNLEDKHVSTKYNLPEQSSSSNDSNVLTLKDNTPVTHKSIVSEEETEQEEEDTDQAGEDTDQIENGSNPGIKGTQYLVHKFGDDVEAEVLNGESAVNTTTIKGVAPHKFGTDEFDEATTQKRPGLNLSGCNTKPGFINKAGDAAFSHKFGQNPPSDDEGSDTENKSESEPGCFNKGEDQYIAHKFGRNESP